MEIIYSDIQTVLPNQNVLFDDTVVGCSNCLMHREGSGLVTLRGATATQQRARYKMTFGANVALPAGGTATTPITLALAINGEGVVSTEMISTPGAVSEFNNVASSTFIDVPRGCCFEVSIKNLTTEAVEVQNANFIVERVA